MLPILPVLLLLLVNAPSKMDRAMGLRAIGVLESLHRKLEGGTRAEAPAATEESERAWASLLSLHLGTADLERAFATLLGLQSLGAEPAPSKDVGHREASSPPPTWDEPSAVPKDANFACRRTRDGPVSR